MPPGEGTTLNFALTFGTGQADHFSGKAGNVREFDSCQANVRGKSQGKLFIVNLIMFSSIVV